MATIIFYTHYIYDDQIFQLLDFRIRMWTTTCEISPILFHEEIYMLQTVPVKGSVVYHNFSFLNVMVNVVYNLPKVNLGKN